MLVRKHEWESTTKKASNRSWDKIFCVLSNKALAAYKDQKHAKADPKTYFHNEQPIDLDGASAAKASDYQKRPHVFRLKLANGGYYLYQCKDDDEMTTWINRINDAVGGDPGAPGGRAQTLPAPGERGEPKRRSFFTLSRKK
jgi:spectrin beta